MTHLGEDRIDMKEWPEATGVPGALSFSHVIRRDRCANQTDLKSQFILLFFRLSHFFTTIKCRSRLVWIAALPIITIYRVLVQWILGVDIPAETHIGAGLRLYHGQALVVNGRVRIGRDCTLRHCTTIGSKVLANGKEGPSPILGDRVDVGSNAVIIGDITIGNDVVIGAGSVVVHNVPSGTVVAGNPARILHPTITGQCDDSQAQMRATWPCQN